MVHNLDHLMVCRHATLCGCKFRCHSVPSESPFVDPITQCYVCSLLHFSRSQTNLHLHPYPSALPLTSLLPFPATLHLRPSQLRLLLRLTAHTRFICRVLLQVSSVLPNRKFLLRCNLLLQPCRFLRAFKPAAKITFRVASFSVADAVMAAFTPASGGHQHSTEAPFFYQQQLLQLQQQKQQQQQQHKRLRDDTQQAAS